VGKEKNTGGEGTWQEGRTEGVGWRGRERREMEKGESRPPRSFLKVGAYELKSLEGSCAVSP